MPMLIRCQFVVCLVGITAGWVPAISFTSPTTGIEYISFNEGPVRLTDVEEGSPAFRVGFRRDDVIVNPDSLDGYHVHTFALLRGEPRSFVVRRDESELVIDIIPDRPEIAAVWYRRWI